MSDDQLDRRERAATKTVELAGTPAVAASAGAMLENVDLGSLAEGRLHREDGRMRLNNKYTKDHIVV